MTQAWKDLRSRSRDPFVVVPNLFTAAECGLAIAELEKHPLKPGRTWNGNDYAIDPAIRSLDTAYVPRSDSCAWIYERMDKAFFACALHLGLEVRETIEDLKLLKYSAGSHFVKWHTDVGADYSALRKISMSVELTASSQYAGGDLQIFPLVEGHVAGPERQAGTAILFPSHLYHRVTPVTRGVRYSLVNWISGPQLQ